MKIALCFIISYDHILNKEHIWRKWIEPNKDIINVYFYYKDLKKIKSEWILERAIPETRIMKTSYFHVIPAYISILSYASQDDTNNQWFCFLTDSCCPIISPRRFRYLFFENYNKTIMSWKRAWWNINFHKRANLALLPENLRLANDPWFVLKREDAGRIIRYIYLKRDITKLICDGGLANESLFAIILAAYNNELKNVICAVTHICDWSRMASSTSPHIFKEGNEADIKFIDNELKERSCKMFIRKIAPEFPDTILENYIYKKFKEDDDKLGISDKLVIVSNDYIEQKFYSYLYVFVFLGYFLVFYVISWHAFNYFF
jgi:hypothetical protein